MNEINKLKLTSMLKFGDYVTIVCETSGIVLSFIPVMDYSWQLTSVISVILTASSSEYFECEIKS